MHNKSIIFCKINNSYYKNTLYFLNYRYKSNLDIKQFIKFIIKIIHLEIETTINYKIT